eukprot:700673-Pyramimonas_sp.AAC.1
MRGAGSMFETVALAETHVKLSGVEAGRSELFKDGWKMVGTPASASASSSSGSRGGEWIVHKRHIAATSWERFRSAKSRAIEGFRPGALHLKRGNVVLLPAYLFPGPKTGGTNIPRIRSISRLEFGARPTDQERPARGLGRGDCHPQQMQCDLYTWLWLIGRLLGGHEGLC